MTDGALFPAARRFARIKKPVFHEFHNDRSRQVSDELDRRQRKARLHQLFISFAAIPCVDVDFFLAHGGQRDQRPNSRRRTDPRNRLFPE